MDDCFGPPVGTQRVPLGLPVQGETQKPTMVLEISAGMGNAGYFAREIGGEYALRLVLLFT